jgi:hypothetical protein
MCDLHLPYPNARVKVPPRLKRNQDQNTASYTENTAAGIFTDFDAFTLYYISVNSGSRSAAKSLPVAQHASQSWYVTPYHVHLHALAAV